MGRYALRLRRLILHHVLHADDTPHRIALGVAIAMFVALMPLVGLQTVIAVGITAAVGANKAVCIPIVWITNPLTLWPIYGGCYALGRFVMASPDSAADDQVLTKLAESGGSASFYEAAFWTRFLEWEFWTGLLDTLGSFGLELWIGCFIVGGALSLLSYPLTRWIVSRYRERRRHRILRRELFRSNIKRRGNSGQGEAA